MRDVITLQTISILRKLAFGGVKRSEFIEFIECMMAFEKLGKKGQYFPHEVVSTLIDFCKEGINFICAFQLNQERCTKVGSVGSNPLFSDLIGWIFDLFQSSEKTWLKKLTCSNVSRVFCLFLCR